jgi:hypothetical protein
MQTTPGIGLDHAFQLALKDLAGHLFKTRSERLAYGAAVLAAFSAAASLAVSSVSHHGAPSGTPVASIDGAIMATNAAAAAPWPMRAPVPAAVAVRNENIRRRLEARLPGLLKQLRDLALAIASVSKTSMRC